jgi:DNA-binding winged helix-turn-helix (wHTH) protein/tetratricopeptide (TPR) repeat protein
MIHAFGECELDEELFQLRRRGEVVRVEPKVFDLLVHLVRHRQRVVSKDELLDSVWPGQSVSESVLPKCVTAARRAVGDPGREVIATVHGRGYRFVAAVDERTAAPTAAPDTPAEAARPFSTPFVGRTQSMERLELGLESAAAGKGRLFLLVGEPGIGKTRTAEEFAAAARRRGAAVLIGRAHEGEGAPAFWPWVQVLRGLLRDADPRTLAADAGPGAADIAAILPELRQRVRTLPPASATASDAARFRLFDSVTIFLQRAAARRPIVVVLDDLHWADEASLRLLGFLARTLAETHLLVLATYRDVEVRRGHPLAELLPALARESACERIALRGLALADTTAFIRGITGRAPSDELALAVQDMTEGNPFFIQEIARLVASEDGAAAEPQRFSLVLPQSVREAIGRRLNALAPPCNDLLRVAAVIGREFSVALLGRVAGLAVERVLADLAEALAARVVDEAPGGLGRYAFHHALIRQTLYEELSTPERARLHARAGEALEAIAGADLEPHLDELAHHYFEAASAGDVGKAVDACVRAAERSTRLLAYEQGAEHYGRAVQAYELVMPRDEARRAELLLGLGETRIAAGRRDAARSAFESAAEIARRLGRVDLLARAALGYRGPAEMGSPPEETTLALLEEALAAIGEAHPTLRARLLSRLVGTSPYSNSMETRARMSEEALALARREGDAPALRDALGARLWACLGPDHVAERLAVSHELLEQSERQQSKAMAILAYEGFIGAHLLRGDTAAADRAIAAYGKLAEEMREPALQFFALFFRGSRAQARGELDEAERLYRAALERGRGVVPYAHFMYVGQMISLVHLRGGDEDPELSRVFFGEMMQVPYSFEPAVRSSLAFAHFLRGDVEAARREIDALAAPGFAALRRDEHWLATMDGLSTMVMLLEDRARAAELYGLLEPYADLIVTHDLLRSISGSVAATLGGLAALLGNYEAGAAHFRHAIDKETALGGVTALLSSKPGYARLLLQRGGPGDRARAESLLAEVRSQTAAHGIVRSWQLMALEQSAAAARRPVRNRRS